MKIFDLKKMVLAAMVLFSTIAPAFASDSNTVTLNPRNVETKYTVVGNAFWKPVSVFDDKVNVFVQFPMSIKKSLNPAFFIISETGKFTAAPTVRFHNNLLIVNGLFKRGGFVYGTGKNRQTVYLIRG